MLRSVTLLLVATMSGMSLWFMAAAVLPDMGAEAGLPDARLALLSSAVPLGFAIGCLTFAATGVPDRLDPRLVFAACAAVTALFNAALVWVPIGGPQAVALRFLTGLAMAGTWPVSMKMAVGWSIHRRGLLMGLVAGALVAGQAAPYLIAWFGGSDWRNSLYVGSAFAACGAVAVLMTRLGPHHARATGFRAGALGLAWTDRRVRGAILGYLGHMWEFIAFWSWVGAMTAASYTVSMEPGEAVALGKLTAFLCILAAAPVCMIGGMYADRIGKARVAALSLWVSGSAALLTALSFGGAPIVTLLLVVVWGGAVVADSPQFSALVADFSPPEMAGSLMTFQASLGFLMTAVTVQATPVVAAWLGWPAVMVILALGPACGLVAMRPAARAERQR